MKGHKWFAAIYDTLSESAERKFAGAVREEMLADVRGEVLEIGAGTGANFPYYKEGARVIASEPDPYMMRRAEKRATETAAIIELRRVAAEDLPFPDASFDFVICTFVLCSVKDPRKVLMEIKRVLKPSGELRAYEHVRYKNPIGALGQDLILPLWRWLGAGCHPNRDSERLIREAGFKVTSMQLRKELPPIPPMIFLRPHLQLVAGLR